MYLSLRQMLLSVMGLTAWIASAAESTVDQLRLQKLEQYRFVRTTANYNDLQLLLGNAEMGSTAKQNGLGFDRLWFSDFWRTAAARMPLYGPCFEIEGQATPEHYEQELDLYSSILSTSYKQGEIAYRSEIFFSEADKDLLFIRLYDLSESARNQLTLKLPILDVSSTEGRRSVVVRSKHETVFSLREHSPQCVLGSSIDEVMADNKRMYKTDERYPAPNKMVYGIWCSAPLVPTQTTGTYRVEAGSEKEVLLVFTESTNWNGGNLTDNVLNQLRNRNDYVLTRKAHIEARKREWERMAVLELPDKRHEQLWYRSQFWLFATSASRNGLPGESQFGNEGWNMIPFTYGSAGWSIFDFTMLGYPEKALHILKQHIRPEAQNRNALHWLQDAKKEREASGMTQPGPYKQDPTSSLARCFAHEIQTSGDCTLVTWSNQAHLQGFALELFQRYYNYYPSEEFLCQYLYPVAKGIAEYFANFLIWNAEKNEYYTAKTWGASEAGMQNNPFDAVMAVKKCLRAATKYARQLGLDEALAQKWSFMEEHIRYPRNESGYVAYLGHDGKIPEDGTGYTGERYINAANFINQELLDDLDRPNVEDLLGRISASNKFGTGFAVFHSAQTATAEALFGRAESALGYINGVLKALDASGTCIRECENNHKTYFITNTDAYLLVPIFMLMQSCKGVIKPFPAVPAAWKDAAFYNLSAESGIRVSGKMQNGKVQWVSYSKDGKELYRTKSDRAVRIDELLQREKK